MITITSVSGGKTSAFLAANYPVDDYVFALVRIEDKNCLYPDKKLRQEVEDRIQKPFIGTAEDDIIIQTMLDLEQFIGQKIQWVSGLTFDEVIEKKGGWLPNKLHRYCTTWMKIVPIFEYAYFTYGPYACNLGFRANEQNRKKRVLSKTENGYLSIEYPTSQKLTKTRRQNWEKIYHQKPLFPLIEDRIFKDQIEEYWKNKPVRFAPLNNCVGCFHRNPLLLRKMFELHPNKMEWFKDAEGGKNGYWKSNPNETYEKIKNHRLQHELSFNDFSECDSGYCELS